MKEVDQGKAIFVVIKLSSTIIDWLITHIIVIDQKYLPEMKAAGVK
jgi:hemerythrin